ncbi:MAG: hypothetical protein K6T90_18510 [Leptolyngbyaceae cyanobacterium HOT.MB2.61]|nr:hypothetical protein [Leptolyngbyaceae cyanobacterium HOT.MB2.61]
MIDKFGKQLSQPDGETFATQQISFILSVPVQQFLCLRIGSSGLPVKE